MRPCGDCFACCSAIGVLELSKAPGVACDHLVHIGKGNHCGIYSGRPDSCRKFDCAWRQGHFSEDDRPDRVGLVFWIPEQPPPGIKEMFIAAEVWSGHTVQGKFLVQVARRYFPVVVMPFGEEKIEVTLEELLGK